MDRPLARALVPLLLLGFGCRAPRIEPFGETRLAALCEDTKRCEAHGDSVVNLLKQVGARHYLVPDKGPEQLLGKVAPARKVDSVLKTCGADIAAQDWLQAPDAVRELELDADGKRALRARLHAYLAARVGTFALAPEQGAEASIRSVVQEVALDRVTWVSQTYWLTDGAFERRVAQCGEEDRENIIYSMTVLSPSASFQNDLTVTLRSALQKYLAGPSDAGAARASETAAEDGGSVAPATQDDRYDTLARDVVRAFSRDARIVAAFGFDDL
jgi:hypothetical protein